MFRHMDYSVKAPREQRPVVDPQRRIVLRPLNLALNVTVGSRPTVQRGEVMRSTTRVRLTSAVLLAGASIGVYAAVTTAAASAGPSHVATAHAAKSGPSVTRFNLSGYVI